MFIRPGRANISAGKHAPGQSHGGPAFETSLGLPWVYDGYRQILEVSGIAGSESSTPREGYARNLGIAEVDRPSAPLPLGGQLGRPFGGSLVEVQDASFEVFTENFTKRDFDLSSATAWRQQRNAEPGLKHCDGSNPNRLRGLPVKPCRHLRIGLAAH
jgi:hypothetical protein